MEQDVSSFINALKSFTVDRVLSSVVLLVLCLLVIRIVTKILGKLLDRSSRVDPRMRKYIMAAVKALLYILTALIVADSLGVPITSLVALFSVLSLAISLAVQDVLGNIAGGLVILFSKPFQLGDYIETPDGSGTVSTIDLTYTKLDTVDGQSLLLPNSTLADSRIVNYTKLGTRRMDLAVSVSYEDSIQSVRAAGLEAVAATPDILEDPAPEVVLTNFGESAIEYHIRCWSRVETYWSARNRLMENIKLSFERNGVTMTYNHLNVHILDKTTEK